MAKRFGTFLRHTHPGLCAGDAAGWGPRAGAAAVRAASVPAGGCPAPCRGWRPGAPWRGNRRCLKTSHRVCWGAKWPLVETLLPGRDTLFSLVNLGGVRHRPPEPRAKRVEMETRPPGWPQCQWPLGLDPLLEAPSGSRLRLDPCFITAFSVVIRCTADRNVQVDRVSNPCGRER